eukprot:gene4842-8682_t
MLSSSRILHHPSDDRASKRVKIDVDETGKDDDGDDDFLADLVVENVHGEEIGQHQQNVEEESVRNTHEDEEIRRLETAVFGHGKSAVVNLSDIHSSQQPTEDVKSRKPAWTDLDDENVSVDISSKSQLRKLRIKGSEKEVSGSQLSQRLRSQFKKIHGRPTWADDSSRQGAIDDDGDVDGTDTELLRSTKSLLASNRDKLVRGIVDISRVKDANCTQRSSAVVQIIDFHPSAPALLTAGLDKTLRIFHVDGRSNKLMSSTYIKNLPMYSAFFSPDGSEIVMSGRRPFFYSFDLTTGKIIRIKGITGRKENSLERMWISPDNQFITFTGRDGHMLLLSQKTKQLIGTLKMNQSCRKAAFTKDSRYLYTTGSEGRVYVWDMNTRDCVNVFEDEGSSLGTAIAVSPTGDRVALG